MLTREMIMARPWPFAGMRVWMAEVHGWVAYGPDDIEGVAADWRKGHSCVLLPGEPGCPPLPVGMQPELDGRFIRLCDGLWVTGRRLYPPGANEFYANEFYAACIPVPDDYVLRTVCDKSCDHAIDEPAAHAVDLGDVVMSVIASAKTKTPGVSREQETSRGAETMSKISPEMIRRRPMPFVGMPVYDTCGREWIDIGQGCVEIDAARWRDGRSSVLLPGEPCCPLLPTEMQVAVGGRYLFRGSGQWMADVRGGEDGFYGTCIPVLDDYVLRTVCEPSAEPVFNEPVSPTVRSAHQFLARVAATLTDKNRRYGDSAANPLRIFSRAAADEQIRVRIDDKLSRISRGTGADDEDTLLDLCGYIALLAAVVSEVAADEVRR